MPRDPRETQIVSICGQLERVAAEIMLKRGVVTRIDLKDFPLGAPLKDNIGQPAAFAIIIREKFMPEFNELVAKLRA